MTDDFEALNGCAHAGQHGWGYDPYDLDALPKDPAWIGYHVGATDQVERDFYAAVSRLTPRARDFLAQARLPIDLIGYQPPRHWARAPLIGVHPITPRDDGSFRLAADGRMAAIMAIGGTIADEFPGSGQHHTWYQITDLVAWYLPEPARWWRRVGLTVAAMPPAMTSQLDDGAPLRLVDTPADYARSLVAGEVATCILDWGLDPRDLVDGLAAVEASPETAKRLRKRIRECGEPRIKVMLGATQTPPVFVRPRPAASQVANHA